MKNFMPLKRAVVEITNEAISGDDQGIKKAVRAWHNRLQTGSIPRVVVTKLGRELFLDLDEFHNWLVKRKKDTKCHSPGRPRSI